MFDNGSANEDSKSSAQVKGAHMNRFSATISVVLVVAVCLALVPATVDAAGAVTVQEATAIAIEVYIYGYPLVTMDMTRRVMTNVAAPADNHAPMGQFFNAREYPNAQFRDITAPNADTLYS